MNIRPGIQKLTSTINTDDLTSEFIREIQGMFPHKNVEIVVRLADATEEILNNPAYAKELEERIKEYERNKKTIAVKPEDLL